MLFHLKGDLLPGGFTGVDIFFVISGYVVSKAAAEHSSTSFPSYLFGFYARRVVRIIPALFVCLSLTTLFTALFIPHSWLSGTIEKTGLWAYLGLSNFALVFFNDGYFSPRTDFNPFVHTWSLGVEEQFYLVFPFVFFIWLKTKQRDNSFRILGSILLPTLAIISFVTSWLLNANPTQAYYLLPSRFWELAAGAMLYQFHSYRSPQINHPALSALGLILLAAGFWFSRSDSFPFPWALLPTIGTLLLLHSSIAQPAHSRNLVAHALQQPIATYIGKTSYSLYLWHWPIYVALRWTVGLESLGHILLAILLTCVLAFSSYHLIETPFRHHLSIGTASPFKKIGTGLAMIAAGYFISTLLYSNRNEISLSITSNTSEWYPYPTANTKAQSNNTEDKTLAGISLYAIGNSHTGAYRKMLQEAEQRLGIRVEIHQIGGCPMGHFLQPIGKDPHCLNTIHRLLKRIEATGKPGDIVFFASLRTHRLIDQWARFNEANVIAYSQSDQNKAQIAQAFEDNRPIIERLQNKGLKILIDAPKPVFRGPPFRCSDWFNKSNPICTDGLSTNRELLLKIRQPVMDSLKKLSQFKNVFVWDPFPIFCPSSETMCNPFDANGRPLFFDGDHMSGHGNDFLFPSFSDLLHSLSIQK